MAHTGLGQSQAPPSTPTIMAVYLGTLKLQLVGTQGWARARISHYPAVPLLLLGTLHLDLVLLLIFSSHSSPQILGLQWTNHAVWRRDSVIPHPNRKLRRFPSMR